MSNKLTRCKNCKCWINPKYGFVSPGLHAGLHTGKRNDPKAPGDYDNICDECNYGKGLRGSPISQETE